MHSLNSIMMFANVLNCATFWYSEGFKHPLLRVVNVPALAILNNMILTDWCLLPAHSVAYTLICTIYRLFFLIEFTLAELGMFLVVAVG